MKLTSKYIIVLLGLVAACDISSVFSLSGDEPSPMLDLECFDACIAKGVESIECEGYCSLAEDDDFRKEAGEKSVDGRWDKDDEDEWDNGGTNPDRDERDREQREQKEREAEEDIRAKECVTCWYEQADCSAQAEACEESLACTQLQWCPFLCDRPDCVQECNEIIPSGVELLTALAECAVCDSGACASECAGSNLLEYCTN